MVIQKGSPPVARRQSDATVWRQDAIWVPVRDEIPDGLGVRTSVSVLGDLGHTQRRYAMEDNKINESHACDPVNLVRHQGHAPGEVVRMWL